MTSPKISIITPSFNQGKYIEQTILSVINQDYNNFELIIIDGGSTDNTLEVIKKYESFIAYWVSEPDNGQAQAINKGIQKATGDIFNWINSDDYLEPDALNTIATFFRKNPEKNALCGYTHCFYDEDNSTSHTYRMGVRKNAADTILNIEMNQPGTFFRMSVIKELEGVNESLNYVFDNELWIRYLAKFGVNGIGLSNKILAQFRLHKNSKTVFDGYARFQEEHNEILKFISKYLSLDVTITQQIKQLPSANRYQPGKWDFTNLDNEIAGKFFADKYLVSLINQNKYDQARRGMIYRIKNSKSLISRLNISAFIKLFLWPGFLNSK